ncbi:hypothetical protein EHV15_34490 [Paenibacillus oralis]|uniref:Uncharacterized protein n=1 Tax=Paenibacillus oralis TaxID=2490856 RepID=A0A3P3TC80_9BACL|nr:hypothetical protein [Paenibacillus oralis]RRJ54708.1 hypothetical protein EHV15_34490 [Paenibacillus oralis]
MIKKRSYKGKVLKHSIWRESDEAKGMLIDIGKVEMMPGLAGTYSWNAKPRSGNKNYHYHGQFDKAIINGDCISFFVTQPVSVNGRSIKNDDTPLITIEFEMGEVSRLLYEDRWFKNQSWFKVLIEELQLSIF